jgi:hypothetical protein
MQTTIGQRILAAVIGHQLGISTDRALKLYVRRCEIGPVWEELGQELLARGRLLCGDLYGLQLVRRNERERVLTPAPGQSVEQMNPRTEPEGGAA